MFTKTKLKNGLRIITAPIKGTKTVTVLLMVGTGSKYETKDINGVSHFLEHMFFKGTRKRPSKLAIAKELDGVGGAYNAFTGKEYTGFWIKVASFRLNLALDVLSDMFLNSKFEESEMKREKKVIVEEINIWKDRPLGFVGMLFEKLLYGNQPAGWNILGTKKSVKTLTHNQLLEYFKDQYVASNTVICIAGNVRNIKYQISNIKNYLKAIKIGERRLKKKVIERQDSPQSLVYYKKTDQTHLCLGLRAYNLFDPRRYPLKLLAIILGGNMSSRLSMSVREREGLAYYVETDSEFNTDSGYLVTQAGVDTKRIKKAIKIILEEYRQIAKKGVAEKELIKARQYIKGRTLIALESSDGIASWLCTQELLRGKISTVKEEFAKIDKVTAKDIQEVARDIFVPEKLNLALIGPFKDKREFDRLLAI